MKRHFDNNADNSTISAEDEEVNDLTARGEPGQYESDILKGGIKYGAFKSRPPTAEEMLNNQVYDQIGDANEGGLGCKNCGSCTETDEEGKKPCCGCVSMDYRWGYNDIPSYDHCTCCSTSPTNGDWRRAGNGNVIPLDKKRSLEEPLEFEEEEFESSETSHQLEKRKHGEAGRGPKWVSICDKRDYARGPGTYPQFPEDPNAPWVGIQNGKWDPISRWWGNTSSLCSDWSVGALQDADKEIISPTKVQRAMYQSK